MHYKHVYHPRLIKISILKLSPSFVLSCFCLIASEIALVLLS